MLDRLRQEDGFTLPELLTTLVISLIVTLGGLTLVEVTMRRSGEIAARVEAIQSGRTAMETVTRELRSQVCLPTAVNGARVSVTEATPSSIVMFTELRDTSLGAVATPTPAPGTISGPDKRQVLFANNQLTETIWKAKGLSNGVYSFVDVGATRELLVNVQQAKLKTATGEDPIPVFRFFKYDFASALAQGIDAQPTFELIGTGTTAAGLTGALSAEQIKSIAKITITYKANPAKKRADGRGSTVFTNSVFTRTVDPNADTDELSEPCI